MRIFERGYEAKAPGSCALCCTAEWMRRIDVTLIGRASTITNVPFRNGKENSPTWDHALLTTNQCKDEKLKILYVVTGWQLVFWYEILELNFRLRRFCVFITNWAIFVSILMRTFGEHDCRLFRKSSQIPMCIIFLKVGLVRN